ncbi:AraC-type DNA-binding protein [Paenibacillus sp. 1_12]|uniref:AraC family transcriptional regulator n=1 Tax=Paenibacillus sp. 1_12 TaxID=1566278 RepID=UPI0008E2C41C|nr:AraC family transcriptional regulator [Paenibacillus sp. 1_12]SFL38622.1 AraC-type DNA-binding protein [Paenibacillus sp. 1_12]
MIKAIRKKFSTSEPFPFQLIFKDTKSPQSELPDHLHDWYEIVYIHSGSGMFFIDSSFYEMTAGDVFLIPRNTIHRAMPQRSDPITSTILFFSSSLLPDISLGEPFSLQAIFEQIRRSKQFRISLEAAEQDHIQSLIEDIRYEIESLQQGFHYASMLTLHRIILSLSRLQRSTYREPSSLTTTGAPWMKELLAYIELNYDDSLSLSSLSQRAHVSPEHFSRVFKQMTGMPLTDYIHTKRILKAQQLLKDTNLAIEVLAEHCGFQSMPHFHRIFKKVTGQTPAAYRKR